VTTARPVPDLFEEQTSDGPSAAAVARRPGTLDADRSCLLARRSAEVTMSVNVAAHPSAHRASTRSRHCSTSTSQSELTVRRPIGPDAAATVAELVHAFVTTGAVNVIVDLEGSVGPDGDVTRELGTRRGEERVRPPERLRRLP
jgi:hypothetical protein